MFQQNCIITGTVFVRTNGILCIDICSTELYPLSIVSEGQKSET